MKKVSRTIRDQLGNADSARVSTAAFGMVNALQNRPKLTGGECLGALAAAFLLALEAGGNPPRQDILGMTKNLMADAQGRRPEFRAIQDYLEWEVFLNR
jgi:hypothetical protein